MAIEESTAITIRKIPVEAKQRLRMRAAAKGVSMEAEARTILLDALDQSSHADINWIQQLLDISIELGGVDLPELTWEEATYADFTEGQ